MHTDADPLALAKLIEGTDAILSLNGFRRDAMYWRSVNGAESISICHFHRCGFVIGIELCAYVYGIRSPEVRKPTAKHVHACASLGQLARVSKVNNNRVILERGKTAENEAIVEDALAAIRTVATPILLDMMSLDGLRRQFNKYGNLRWAMVPELRSLLYGSSIMDIPGEIPWQPWELGQ